MPLPPKPAGYTATPHFTLLTLIGQIAFVAILAQFSDSSPHMETIAMTLIAGLWLAYLVHTGPRLIAAITPSGR